MPPANYSFVNLLRCVDRGDAELCATIIKEHPEYANSKNIYGYTALMVAAVYGHTECLRLLLSEMSQETIDAVNDDGGTALSAAVKSRRTKASNTECIALLLDRVSPDVINSQENDGNTLLLYAIDAGRTEGAKLIARKMSAEALRAKGSNGCNALMHAAVKKDLEFFRFILPLMPEDAIIARTPQGVTLLEWLYSYRNAAYVEALIYHMSKDAVTSVLHSMQCKAFQISEECDRVLKRYYNKMHHAPGANITAVNNVYYFWVDNTVNINEMQRVCDVLEIKDVVLNNVARPEIINALLASIRNVTICAGVTPEAIAAIPSRIRFLIIVGGATAEAVAAIPNFIKRVIIAYGASPDAIASLPLNIKAVYIGSGVTPDAVAAIPARIITVKLLYDVGLDVVQAVPKTAKHISINNKLTAKAAAGLHADVTDIVLQGDSEDALLEVLCSKSKPITFWVDQKQSTASLVQLRLLAMSNGKDQVIAHDLNNMQCVPYKPRFEIK